MQITTIAIICGGLGFAFGLSFADSYLATAAAASEDRLEQCQARLHEQTASIQKFINEVK